MGLKLVGEEFATQRELSDHDVATAGIHGVGAKHVAAIASAGAEALPLAGGKMTGDLRIEKASPKILLDGGVDGAGDIEFWEGATSKGTMKFYNDLCSWMNLARSAYTFAIDLDTGNIPTVGNIQDVHDVYPDGTTRNLGTAAKYWNEIHYHTLVSHSPQIPESFDEQVAMLNQELKGHDIAVRVPVTGLVKKTEFLPRMKAVRALNEWTGAYEDREVPEARRVLRDHYWEDSTGNVIKEQVEVEEQVYDEIEVEVEGQIGEEERIEHVHYPDLVWALTARIVANLIQRG